MRDARKLCTQKLLLNRYFGGYESSKNGVETGTAAYAQFLDERVCVEMGNPRLMKLRQRLEKEMMEVSFAGDVSSYYLQKQRG